MSSFGLLSAFGSKRCVFPLRLSNELAWEANGISTMQHGFPGLFTQPLKRAAQEQGIPNPLLDNLSERWASLRQGDHDL